MTDFLSSSLKPAGCGYCGLEGPDEFGNYDLIESVHCPVHGAQPDVADRWAEQNPVPPEFGGPGERG